MADHWHAPGTTQQSLPCQAAHVGHIRVVDRKAKDSVSTGCQFNANTLTHKRTDKRLLHLG